MKQLSKLTVLPLITAAVMLTACSQNANERDGMTTNADTANATSGTGGGNSESGATGTTGSGATGTTGTTGTTGNMGTTGTPGTTGITGITGNQTTPPWAQAPANERLQPTS